jgi:putative serine protease PepD
MTEQHGHGDGPAEGTPWWSRPSGDAWDAPTYAAPPADRPAGRPTDTSAHPSDVLSGGPDRGYADTYGDQPEPAPAFGPGSLWAFPDDDRDRSRGGGGVPGTGVLVVLGLVVALLAGSIGGAAGYLLAESRDGGGSAVDGANLGSAPARSQERPAGSVPGVAAKVLPSVVQIKVDTRQGRATGSGFVVDENGLIVTNNHVVDGASSGGVEVTFADGTTVDGSVVGTSASYDLAVLEVSGRNLAALPLGNSDSVVVGDPVIAIGSPLGLSGTVTSGIVSAKDRPVTAGGGGGGDSAYINAIQTDAAINPGNSGGPLVNLQGEVIGVNSAIATVGTSLGGEGGNIGVGFAIPINQARRTAEQIIDTGEAQFPIIGASLDGTYSGQGARIAEEESADGTPPLVPGGPAEQAGLRPGDVITAIDGEPVEDSSELIVAIRARRPGDEVRLTVQRGERDREVRITLASSSG